MSEVSGTVMAIRVEDVFKRYGWRAPGVEALRGVSLAVKPGEIYGLLGRNGAGKTTLVKLLLDIVRPTSGKLAVLDRPPKDPASRRPVGYLPEDHRFPDYHTGESAMHYYARLSNVPADLRRARIPELLKMAGLAEAGRRKIRAYSKGMKQRLGLAQALVHDPQILFLDEPTDGVDPVGRAEIRTILERLKGEGKTIFLNSHLLSEVERVCDRVGILEKGKLVREGTIDELTRTGCVFTVETAPPPGPEILEALKPLTVAAERTAEGLSVGLEKDSDVDRVVDLLRARGLSIRGLACKRLSLEEVFLDAVNGAKKEEAR